MSIDSFYVKTYRRPHCAGNKILGLVGGKQRRPVDDKTISSTLQVNIVRHTARRLGSRGPEMSTFQFAVYLFTKIKAITLGQR